MSAAPEVSAPVRIDTLAQDGRGVARRDGKAIFVRGALPGETVELARVRGRRRYDEAVAGRVLEETAVRTLPRCRHFGVCGGCTLQHLDGGAQLASKEESLLQVLERVGGVRPRRTFPRIDGPSYGYRRRARLGVKHVRRKNRVVVGFREAGGRLLTDSSECPVLAPPGSRLPALLSDLVGTLAAKARIPQVEFAAGDWGASLVFRILDLPRPEDIRRLVEFGRRHDIAVWIQTAGPDSLRLLHGPALLGYALPAFNVALHFLPTDFVQVNGRVNRSLVGAAVARLELGAGDRVLDLYSGIGNFSLALARRAREVVTVEGSESLVRRARANAQANGIVNVEHHIADLSFPGSGAGWLAGGYDAVVLDPPRSGARALIPALARVAPSRILYVSCHPATLARDAAALAATGYTLEAAGVADMFPQTAHAEAMALFRRA